MEGFSVRGVMYFCSQIIAIWFPFYSCRSQPCSKEGPERATVRLLELT
jgi:hypothetical protein